MTQSIQTAETLAVEHVARVIAEAWSNCREVPFPLYDSEAKAMALYLIAEFPALASQEQSASRQILQEGSPA